MSNQYMQFANDVRTVLRGLAGLESAAAAFEEVGKLEQTKNELTAAVANLRALCSAKLEEVRLANEALMVAQLECKQTVTDATARAESLMLEANTKVAAIESSAAETESAKLADLHAQCERAREELAAATAANEAQQAIAAELEARVAAAKEYLRSIAQG